MKLRLEKRLSVTYEHAKIFYDAIFPRIEEIIAYLDQGKIADFTAEQNRLLYMLFSVAEISTSIEIYKQMTVPAAVPHDRFPMWEAVSDEW